MWFNDLFFGNVYNSCVFSINLISLALLYFFIPALSLSHCSRCFSGFRDNSLYLFINISK